jgi:hypothetical protein
MGRDNDRISDDDTGAWQLMEFFVLCGASTCVVSSGCRFALKEFACFQLSKGVDRFKLHVRVLNCGSNDVKKLPGLNWK